jgi:hypothetical protein
MDSPFPGMDPYLESRWSDVHVKLISFIGEALQPLLPRDLRARSEERVLLEEEDEAESRAYRSDVAIVDTGRPAPAVASASVATVEPIFIRRQPAPIFDRFVQIIDVTSGNRVVTAIEVLSPWNKAAGRLNRAYLRKLDDYARGGVNVIEVDLLRYPTRGRLNVTETDIPAARRTAYVTCVRRAWESETWIAYPMPLRAPLPPVPVPLRQRDGEIELRLQPLIARVYAASGHDDIDYSRSVEPPLEAEDAEWADRLLKEAGRR